jgi:hypothetical protein
MSRSISSVKVELNGQTFTLLADLSALAELEEVFGEPWFQLMARFGGGVKIADLAKIFAALARDETPDVTLADVLTAMDTLDGYRVAMRAVESAIAKAMPAKASAAEVGEEAEPDPH